MISAMSSAVTSAMSYSAWMPSRLVVGDVVRQLDGDHARLNERHANL
jgi:hypothetical protein